MGAAAIATAANAVSKPILKSNIADDNDKSAGDASPADVCVRLRRRLDARMRVDAAAARSVCCVVHYFFAIRTRVFIAICTHTVQVGVLVFGGVSR